MGLDPKFGVDRHLAERGDQILRLGPHAGIDEADIAARSAEADHLRFDDCSLHAFFGKMQGRGQSGKAPADDRDIDGDIR